MTSTQPVAIGGVIQLLLIGILGVIAAWYPLTDTQFNSILVLIGAISAAVTWWVNRQTTPTAKPTDDGQPLVLDSGNPGPTAAGAGRFVVKAAPRGAMSGAAPTAATWNK